MTAQNTQRGFDPFDGLLQRVRSERLRSWTELERQFLAIVAEFDTIYSRGGKGSGWYQMKARYFNDLVVGLLENCSEKSLGTRVKRQGLLFPHADLDICYPAKEEPPLVAGEVKILGAPPHPRNKHRARDGSADLDKRLREVAITSLDIKASCASARDRGIAELRHWVTRTDPSYFSFWAFRINGEADFERCLDRLQNLSKSYCDGVGAVFYEAKSPATPTEYKSRSIPRSLEIGSVLETMCSLIASR